jgi:hypothetical protein
MSRGREANRAYIVAPDTGLGAGPERGDDSDRLQHLIRSLERRHAQDLGIDHNAMTLDLA